MRSLLLRIYNVIARFYVFIFGRHIMQPINNTLLNFALLARGYGSYHNLESSGEAALIRRIAGHGPSLCVDVGANVGQYSELLLKYTNAKILAFEPLPKAFAELQSLQNKFHDRFECSSLGLGNETGNYTLHYPNETSQLAGFVHPSQQPEDIGKQNIHSMQVPVATLDSFFASHSEYDGMKIDLMKLDVEGFESNILAGAEQLIADGRILRVQIESCSSSLMIDQSIFNLSKLLPKYRIYQLLPYDGGVFEVKPEDYMANIFAFSNFVFVHPNATL